MSKHGKRLCFGDIASFTMRRLGPDAWRLGIEHRDDPDDSWGDGAWLNELGDEHVRALAEFLLATLVLDDRAGCGLLEGDLTG